MHHLALIGIRAHFPCVKRESLVDNNLPQTGDDTGEFGGVLPLPQVSVRQSAY